MTPWIQVYTNLSSHRKVCQLRDLLGFKTNYEAVGILICLWCWVAINSPNGSLDGYGAQDIAGAVGYKKAPAKLMTALVAAGFLDQHESGSVTIHDWEEHAALLMDSNEQQKKNTRERVRRYRERRKANNETDVCNGSSNVTCNACNAPTLPNLTLPNLTIDFSGSSSSGAGAVSQRIEDITVGLFMQYCGRKPTLNDAERVQNRVRFNGGVNSDAVGLLEYAFEAAAKAGLGGNWNYIEAVLDRCSLNDITTAAEARMADMERGECV